jgi:hypothetical protein
LENLTWHRQYETLTNSSCNPSLTREGYVVSNNKILSSYLDKNHSTYFNIYYQFSHNLYYEVPGTVRMKKYSVTTTIFLILRYQGEDESTYGKTGIYKF